MSRAQTTGLLVALGLAGGAAAWRHLGAAAASAGAERVIRVTAKKFAFSPSEITLAKGIPVVLEITSLDREHGFKVPKLGIRADVKAGETTRVRLVPEHTGRFAFRCDVFCGSGHDGMAGEIVVVDGTPPRQSKRPRPG